MSEGPPTLSIEGHRARLRLNRPSVHNRISSDDIAVIMELLDAVDAAADVRVMVLSAGGKSFSSGFYIQEIGTRAGSTTSGFDAMTDRMERVRVPVICALQGGVYGGSTDLALACDFRIGVKGMGMFMPAAKLGLHYYPGGMQRYVSRLGVDNAKRLFLTGEKVDAEELYRIGFLTELVAPEELEAAVDARAGQLEANAPLAVQGMKKALNDIARGDADLAEIAARAAEVAKSEDLKEGGRAFAEKRPARFIGR